MDNHEHLIYLQMLIFQMHMVELDFNITNDQLGAFNNTWLNVGYAFIQDIQHKFKITVGLNAGINISKLDGTKLITPQGTNTDLNDDNLLNQQQQSFKPNLAIGLGIMYKYFDFGISYNNIINAKDNFRGELKN
jgi:hypothetical protein